MSAFTLDPKLKEDTVALASWPLSDVLLMNDSQYPWLILVPRIDGATELFHLSKEQRLQFDEESTFLAKTLSDIFKADKMNVAALGNVVKQLHIHHVVRYDGDAAWPAPIWGKLPVKAYNETDLESRLAELKTISSKSW